MTTLHIIDDAEISASPVTGARMRDSLIASGPGARALVLGRGARADNIGLTTFDTLPVSQVPAPLRSRTLKRWLKQHGPFDHVTAWSEITHTLAKRAAGHTPVTLGPATPIVIDTNRFNPSHRALLRQRFDVPDNVMLIHLAADRLEHTDTRGLIKLIGLMTDAERPVRFLTHPDARTMLPARRMMADLDLFQNLTLYEHADEPWHILPAVDIVFVHGPAARWQWTALWAAVAKVPVLAIQDHPDDPIDPVWAMWNCPANDWRHVSRAIMRIHHNRERIAGALEEKHRRIMRSALRTAATGIA